MPTTSERIVSAMERNGVTFADVIQRVAHDESISAAGAADLVSRLEGGFSCPTPVAAAVISILADRRSQ